MKKQEINKLKIKYIFSDDYNPVYVNGAYGGLSPRGDIVINFYFERQALPNIQTYEMHEGIIGPEIIEERDPADHLGSMVRYVSNGIILDYQNAKEIHRWLGTHIKSMEDNKNIKLLNNVKGTKK